MTKPIIDAKKCTKCATCVEICPIEVFRKDGATGEVVVGENANDCLGCRACEVNCPAEAIVIED